MGPQSPDCHDLANAKKSVYRLLKIRPRSQDEIEQKLSLKGYHGDIIAETVQFFKKSGFINDVMFAKAWVQSRLRKPVGKMRIIHELKTKGIDKEIIEKELALAIAETDQAESISNLVHIVKRRYGSLDQATKKQRIIGFLARRGFEYRTIQQVLKQISKKRCIDDSE